MAPSDMGTRVSQVAEDLNISTARIFKSIGQYAESGQVQVAFWGRPLLVDVQRQLTDEAVVPAEPGGFDDGGGAEGSAEDISQ
jgi:hypothetical protein